MFLRAYPRCLLISALVLCGCDAGLPLSDAVDLSGEAAVRSGDSSAWAAAEFDDSEWQKQRVPQRWLAAGLPWTTTCVWYRLRFPTSDVDEFQTPALLLTRVARSDECFLNGQRIGGLGLDGARVEYRPQMPRLYRLPTDQLRRDDRLNVLAIRVASPMPLYDGGGIVGPLMLGEFTELFLRAEQSRRGQLINEVATLLLLAFFTFGSLCLTLTMPRERKMVWAAIGGGYATLTALASSALGYELGVWEWFPAELVLTVDVLSMPLLLGVACRLLTEAWTTATCWFLVVSCVINLLLIPVAFDEHLAKNILVILGFASAIGFLGYTLSLAVRSFRDSDTGVRFFAGGLLLSLLSFGIELLIASPSGSVSGVTPTWFGIMLLVFGFFGMIIFQSYAALRQFREVARRVLRAQADERARLGRELHDGVIQSVLAIQLELEMREALPSSPESGGPMLRPLIDRTRLIAEEIRDLSRDLRPEYIDRLSLAELFRYHLDNIAAELQCDVHIEVAQQDTVSPEVRENLYRVFQEAIRNIIRHANAERVEVTLRDAGADIELTIADDGRGFPEGRVPQPRRGSSGVGLSTIRERAGLLGGVARLTSGVDGGVQVSVRVPRFPDEQGVL